jgi:hypothetical protein
VVDSEIPRRYFRDKKLSVQIIDETKRGVQGIYIVRIE